MEAITIQLHDLGSKGDAVGRHEGLVVYVPLGLAGETVRAEIVERCGHYARARLLEVLEPSADRIEPPCPHFGVCGGCHLQHFHYAAQLCWKREAVRAQLRGIGGLAEVVVQPTFGMAQPWAYRNHVQLAVDASGGLGYKALHSHDVVVVEQCLVTHPLLDELWGALDLDPEGPRQVALRAGVGTGEQMIIFEGPPEDVPELTSDLPVSCVYLFPDGEFSVLVGEGHIHETLLSRGYRISAPSFFQVNTEQTECLLGVVERYLELRPGETLLDAYSGVGVLALSMVGQAGRVVGIESSHWAVADAQANTQPGEEAHWLLGAVEDVLPELQLRADAIVLDPPRAGCDERALRALAACEASRLVYVSCDPATLARDVKRLGAYGYRLIEVQPVDMFPQTYHIECVALLRR